MKRRVRIRVLSDLHNGFEPFVPPNGDADVTVLAGDIDIDKMGFRRATSAFSGRPLIYVAGNHEYYGRAIPRLTGELIELGAGSNISVHGPGGVR